MNNTLESFLYRKNLLRKVTKNFDLYYPRPELDDDGMPKTVKVSYKRLGRNSHQKVCDRYYKKSNPNEISYYRHLAFQAKFLRIDNSWYLEITPTYYFTHDGFKLHTYYEGKLKGKKALDRPETVFSETLFWEDILTREQNSLFGKPILSFGFLFKSTLERGIDDKRWLEKEDDEKKQTLTNQSQIFHDGI